MHAGTRINEHTLLQSMWLLTLDRNYGLWIGSRKLKWYWGAENQARENAGGMLIDRRRCLCTRCIDLPTRKTGTWAWMPVTYFPWHSSHVLYMHALVFIISWTFSVSQVVLLKGNLHLEASIFPATCLVSMFSLRRLMSSANFPGLMVIWVIAPTNSILHTSLGGSVLRCLRISSLALGSINCLETSFVPRFVGFPIRIAAPISSSRCSWTARTSGNNSKEHTPKWNPHLISCNLEIEHLLTCNVPFADSWSKYRILPCMGCKCAKGGIHV